MKRQIYRLLISYIFFVKAEAFCNLAPLSDEITTQRLHSHVQYLSSDALKGRLTGSKGEQLATQYIADIFQQLGLEPAGDKGTFFQTFTFKAGVVLGKNNVLLLTDPKGLSHRLQLEKAWRPLAFSETGNFTIHELIFAGYGIRAPSVGSLTAFDSYQGLDVKHKWVVVLNGLPEEISDQKVQQFSPYASLRYKTFIAKTKGAQGIIFITQNDSTQQELIPFTPEPTSSAAGIFVLSINNALVNQLLYYSEQPLNSLKKIQAAIASQQKPVLPQLKHLQISGQIDFKKRIRLGHNVLAKLRMTPSAKAMIIIGAHVDHLGLGTLGGSREENNSLHKIHSGADDNASGVACMLEAARQLSVAKTRGIIQGEKDILFAAWSGEEFGILGSSHFVKQLSKHQTHHTLHDVIDAVINLDMVGHLSNTLILQGVASSPNWVMLIKRVFPSMSLVIQNEPYLPTDSTSFYLQGVPILNFFTGAHENYHTSRDKVETLNIEGMKVIADFLVHLLYTMEDKTSPMIYQAISHPNETRKRVFKIYLGTIPDYSSPDVIGVKLSGVAKESPAQQAGILAHDVIIKLDEKKIHDIYDYTYALNGLTASKPVKIVVLRGQGNVELTVIPRYRE